MNIIYLVTLFLFLICDGAEAKGFYEMLAEGAYSIVHEPCVDSNNYFGFQSLSKAAKNSGCPVIYNQDAMRSSYDMKIASERIFFDLSRNHLRTELLCRQSQMEKVFGRYFVNTAEVESLSQDIIKKVPVLSELKNEIQNRINKFQIIQGNLPKNLNNLKLSKKDERLKQEAQNLNEEIKELLIRKHLIIQSIPFSENPEFEDFIDSLDEKSIANPEEFHKKVVKKGEDVVKSLKEDLSGINKMASKLDDDYPVSFKERIAQNPEFIESMLKKNDLDSKQVESLRCHIDKNYGAGAKARDQLLLIGSTALSFGLTATTANVALKSKNVFRALGSPVLKTLAGTSLALTSLHAAKEIKSECFSENIERLIISNNVVNCESEDINIKIKQNNCALAVAFPVFGVTVSGLLYTGKMAVLVKDMQLAKSQFDELYKRYQKLKELPKVSVPVVSVNHFQNMQDLIRSGKILEAKKYEENVVRLMKTEKMDFVSPVGEGVSGANFVKFSDGVYGVWKPARMTEEGFNTLSGPAEIMAYKVDRYIGWNRVPTTVIRELDGKKGTVQLMVGNLDKSKLLPNYPRELKMFDYLLKNNDRHGGNYLLTKDGRIVAIDHGLSAKSRNSNGFPRDVAFEVNDYKKILDAKFKNPMEMKQKQDYIISRLRELIGDKTHYTKLKLTSEKQWRSLLSPEMNSTQINDFIRRRDEVIEAVENARFQIGEGIFK